MGAPAVQPLISGLTDGNAQVRGSAARALDRLGWRPDTGPAGAAYWAAKGEWDRCVALGGPAVGPLLALLERGSTADQAAAVQALGRVGAPAVEPALGALAHPQWRVRAGAAEALGGLADRRAVPPLMDSLSDSQWETRKAAANALAQLYRSGTLDEAQKGLLLQRRAAITAAHEDQPPSHYDRTVKEHTDYKPSSDCTDHEDVQAGHTDRPYGHVDEGGIGVEVPF
jgi:HEAT repeat protein